MGPWTSTMKENSIKEVLEVVMEAFDIDNVIVIDDETLYSMVQQIDNNKVIENLQKMGGVSKLQFSFDCVGRSIQRR